ncbi:serine hydrolase domain-containing protein [Paenibacillus harenae]|uniref:CubicO group peptidase (Beta-lactamase class C family) n=1 Tax=Paenibacillus harenae TaxID=306543 RepID=A0ABT9UAR1_PAEHA|nr:serine hydrolase [Paenibacillus harenae]MDQ0116735.1 CubicO group peptidase (beta-lactamase class C family) [Paenibacillus harenae]
MSMMKLPSRLESIEEQLRAWKMNTVIVLQGGEVAAEWYELGADAMGSLYSCTKSVLSCLIGMAIDEGRIESVDQPIFDYLDHPAALRLADESEAPIRIKHLLSMTSGFEWPDFDKPYRALRASSDPIGFVLDRPIISPPGQAYAYNSGASHLLSAILTKAVGTPALAYASEKLFQPLQFRKARWTKRDGVNEGGTGLSLYGMDLAKFGQLYLKEGIWQGERLLSTEWINLSTEMHHRGLLHYEPPIYGEYGYHWWRTPVSHNGCADCYFAFGHGGQYLLIVPDYELVIVVRKAVTKRNDADLSRRLIFEELMPKFS